MPYSCGTCGKMFRQNGSLYNHQKTHKGLQEGRKKYKAKRPVVKNKNSKQSYSESSWKNESEMNKCYFVSSSSTMSETSDDCSTNNAIIATDISVLDKIEEVCEF